MRCPKCKSEDVYVVDSRSSRETTWRRRECSRCNHRFNTMEVDEALVKALERLRAFFQGREEWEEDCRG